MVKTISNLDNKVETQGRKVALSLQQLMSIVDYDYNRHESCLVCGYQFKQHEGGLPCVSDKETKDIITKDKWGNIKVKKYGTSRKRLPR